MGIGGESNKSTLASCRVGITPVKKFYCFSIVSYDNGRIKSMLTVTEIGNKDKSNELYKSWNCSLNCSIID